MQYGIFSNKKVKIAGLIISIIIIIVASVMAFTNRIVYDTTILTSDSYSDVSFDDKCKVYLENDALGKVNIEYNEIMDGYVINAEFTRSGKTNLVIEDENDNKTVYELSVGNNTFEVNKK